MHYQKAFRITTITLSACIFWFSTVSNAFSQTSVDGEVQYSLTCSEPASHLIEIELKIVPKQSGDLELFVPVWTPGSYLVREYARHIEGVVARDADGKELTVDKTTKNRWLVKSVSVKPVTVRYAVYCNELSVRTNFVDSEFGILAGAATFLTSRDHTALPHRVEVRLPRAWRQVVTALEHAPGANVYQATNYDELVDSPILMGNPSVHSFEVGGVNHLLVNQGGDELWNGDAAAAAAAKIVEEHQKMWGSVPYKRYIFFNLIAEGSGGLEHDNGTVLLTSRWHYRNKKNYEKWLGLVSHEFFHAWNVRRMRPKVLTNYDYESEVYFDELWMAEGITSYYDDLAVARCGLMSTKEYLTALSKQIETLQTTPGRAKQSLTESSHDAWIKYYRPDENTANSSINYYNKGAIAGFLLDIAIRKQTNNQKSLDDLMRTLYERHAGRDKGYTNEDICKIASELTGQEMQPWFAKVIDSHEELDYQPALDWLGVRFKGEATAAKNGNSNDDDRDKEEAKPGTAWIGVATETKEGRTTITKIAEGTAAHRAGLNFGDELIALNGYRLTEPLEARLTQFSPTETVQVLIARRGKVLELAVPLEPKPSFSWSMELVKDATEQQRASFESWLHTKLPQIKKASEMPTERPKN